MRILHIDPDDIDNPLSGGGPVRTLEIYRRLTRRHEVTVLTPTFPGSTPEKIRDGIRYIRLGRRIGDHGSSHHITYFFALPRAVRCYDHDLMVEDFMPPAAVTANPLFTKAPVIGSVQWFNTRTLAKQYRLPFHWIEAVGLHFYKNLICVSEANARTLRQSIPRATVKVIPNGIDESLFQVDGRLGEYILYLGRVDLFRKGVGLLLDAYALLPEANRPELRNCRLRLRVRQGTRKNFGARPHWIRSAGRTGRRGRPVQITRRLQVHLLPFPRRNVRDGNN